VEQPIQCNRSYWKMYCQMKAVCNGAHDCGQEEQRPQEVTSLPGARLRPSASHEGPRTLDEHEEDRRKLQRMSERPTASWDRSGCRGNFRRPTNRAGADSIPIGEGVPTPPCEWARPSARATANANAGRTSSHGTRFGAASALPSSGPQRRRSLHAVLPAHRQSSTWFERPAFKSTGPGVGEGAVDSKHARGLSYLPQESSIALSTSSIDL